MNLAKYIIDLCKDEEQQLDILLKYKDHLAYEVLKDECGCSYYILKQENLEPLRVYLNVCYVHLFQNKIIVDEVQIRHKTCNFKPLVWND